MTLRSPTMVMRLSRLGSFHQSRLSFMRSLLRRLKDENWSFERPVFSFDKKGVGVAVYTGAGPKRTYSLVCFGHDLEPEERSDRVIAHKWDSTFTLFDGVPTQADIERLSQNVPRQEAGRVSNREISVSRANRSVRLFNHVLESLTAGKQPDEEKCLAVGYLMRTTAVYGSGKFGAADRELIANREELAVPFQAEMLLVYLIRSYSLDLVEHMAKLRAPETAVTINAQLRHCFGIGNSTGLGLAPFVINHPVLLNNWIAVREEALHRVCAIEVATAKEQQHFSNLLKRAQLNTANWRSEHPIQIKKINELNSDLASLDKKIAAGALNKKHPWQSLYAWAEENLSLEGQEQLVSLMLEPYGKLVDRLCPLMEANEAIAFCIDGAMPLKRMKKILEKEYAWALDIDWDKPDNQAYAWYISAEKLEPRIGKRFEESIAAYEQPLAPGRDAKLLYCDIKKWRGEATLAAFLLRHPQHRHIARRVQIVDCFPYAEIRDNTISQTLLPIDMLRLKLAFFGATHFDPRSDRWVRINMYKNAPFPADLKTSQADDWSYPQLEEAIA